MKMIGSGDLKDFIRIERPVPDESFDGAGSGSWELVASVFAEVQDALPSRGERLADGINIATRPARVRMRWRNDVTPAMRFVRGADATGEEVDYSNARVMQIVGGPAEIGRREGLEFMVEDYSTAGSGA